MTSSDGSKIFALPRKTLDVLAYLILNRGRALARTSVAFSLFPDDEEELARGALRRNLSYLLSSLPQVSKATPFVVAEGKSILWNPVAPAAIDIDEFEQAIVEGRDSDAIALYRGELLPTLYADWTTAERERLRAAYLDVLMRELLRHRSIRRFDEASAVARTLLNDDPWREDVVRLLMAIRYEAGDRSGALAEFERFAERLRSEMRTDPMPETIFVRDAVLRGDRLPTSERGGACTTSADGAAPFGLDFVGREGVMELALARWHVSADGRGGALFVAGEAGIGKSRFAIELARAIEREGGIIVAGQTSAGGERQPYEAFLDALTRARPDPSDKLLGVHTLATLTDDRAARVRFFEMVRSELAELVRRRPAVLVLEDLHWAGNDTIALLDYILQRLAQVAVLIVVTMRTDELLRAHPLRTLSRYLESHGAADVVTLGRLKNPEAALALSAALDDEIDRAVIDDAISWADGVPLLLVEAGREVAAGRPPIRGDIATLVGDRFARLTPPASTALAYSAAIGNRFELATVSAATGWSDSAVIDALGESLELGLVRVADSGGGIAFSFTHHVLHAAAYERIDAAQRVTAHAMVARVLEALPQSTKSGSAEVARQFERAGEATRSARHWSHAADYALSIFANEDARAAATAGLNLAGADLDLRFELLAAREDALRRLGALAERRADSLALVDCAGGDAERRCNALERMFDAHRDDAGLRRRALQELAELAPQGERFAAVFERTASRDAFMDDEFGKARDAALRSAQRFERLGEERDGLLARLTYIAMLRILDETQAAEHAIDELRSTIEATADVALAAEFYRVAANAAGDDRCAATLADARRSLELALRLGDRYAEARAREILARMASRVRKYSEASSEFERALQAYRDVGDASGANNTILNLAAAAVWHADFISARRLLNELLRASRRHVLYARLIRGYADLREGKFERARAELTKARDDAVGLGLPLLEARAIEFLAELSWLRRDDRRTRMLLDAALDRLSELGQPALCAEQRAFSARLHAENGELQAALDDAKIAAESALRYPIQEYSRLYWNLAVAHALSGDETAATDLAGRSARGFVEDAMEMDAARAETYSSLPWHREAIAFLSGRGLPERPVSRSTAGNASGTLRS